MNALRAWANSSLFAVDGHIYRGKALNALMANETQLLADVGRILRDVVKHLHPSPSSLNLTPNPAQAPTCCAIC